jgi:formate dehydrogenase
MASTGSVTPSNGDKIGEPAGGRRRPTRTPKGRQVDPGALAAVRPLLGPRAHRRDSDRAFCICSRIVTAIFRRRTRWPQAQEMKLAPTEVYEVATFTPISDFVKEGEAPPAVTVRVCGILSCAMAGADHLLRELPNWPAARSACCAPLHGRLRPRAGAPSATCR